jgi:hypothetical protein
MGSNEGRGPQTDKTPAAKSLYKSIFFITTFGVAFYQSNLSTTGTLKTCLTKSSKHGGTVWYITKSLFDEKCLFHFT